MLRQFSLSAAFGAAFADPALRALMKPEFQWELSEALRLTVADVQRAAVDRTRWYDAVLGLFEAARLPRASVGAGVPVPHRGHLANNDRRP